MVIVLAVLAGRVMAADPVLINQDWWIPNGEVNEIVVGSDGTTYLGGRFTAMGPYTGSFVSLDVTTGEHDNTFPKVNGPVNTVVSDGLGGWYIGGSFTRVGDFDRQNLAHILPDKTVDPNWNPGAENIVSVLVVDNNIIYVGGFLFDWWSNQKVFSSD